jgi:hypothetical protein
MSYFKYGFTVASFFCWVSTVLLCSAPLCHTAANVIQIVTGSQIDDAFEYRNGAVNASENLHLALGSAI